MPDPEAGPSDTLKQLFSDLQSHFEEPPTPKPSSPEAPPATKATPVGPPPPALAARRRGPPPPPSGFGAIMDLAGKLRPTNAPEAGRLDRYAQGISTSKMPGFTPALDIPMNIALATGYEGLKGTAQAGIPGLSPAAQAALAKMGYEIKPQGQPGATSPASLGNVYSLYRGLTGS
jgi:hypothetical protein